MISPLSRYVPQHHWIQLLEHTTDAPWTQRGAWRTQCIQQDWGRRNVCNHSGEGCSDLPTNWNTRQPMCKSQCQMCRTFHSIFWITCGTKCISNMLNGLEIITEQLSNSEQPHVSFQVLPDAPRYVECKAMCSQVLRDYFTGAPQCSGNQGTEYKNFLKSV